jgi:flagellar motor switch protein FliG
MVSRLLPRDLGLVLSALKETDIALALITQSEDLRERMGAALSQRRRECLQEELLSLASKRGQIRRRDVENATGIIINTAITMHGESKIVFPWEEEMV